MSEAPTARPTTPDTALDEPALGLDARLLAAAGATLLLALFASLWIQTRVSVTGAGLLLHPGGVTRVMSRYEGEVEAVLVEVGALVHADAPLLRLRQPQHEHALEQLAAQYRTLLGLRAQTLALHEAQRQREAEAVARERQAIRAQRSATEALETSLAQRYEGEVRALARGLLPDVQVTRTRSERDAARTELARLDVALAQLERDLGDRESQRERERLSLDQQLAQLEADHRRRERDLESARTLRSPAPGRVLELQVRVGQVLDAGSPVARIGPAGDGEDRLQAQLLLPAGEAKRVQPGMAVQLSPGGADRNRYGYLRGRVAGVDPLPTTPEAFVRVSGHPELLGALSAGAPVLRVQVDLEPDPRTPGGYAWTGSRGPDWPLSAGALVQGEVVIEKRSLLLTLLPFLQPRRVDRLLTE